MENMEDDLKHYHCDAMNISKALHDICNWNCLENVAIEYHDLEKVLFINYTEVYATKQTIHDSLMHLESFELVGINVDVPEYCVPSLMLGILTSGHGFINMPSDSALYTNIITSLHIRYLFTKHVPPDGEIMRRLTVHDELVYLTSLKGPRICGTGNMTKIPYAYAICTSGSTGSPKVVKVLHACIVPNILDLKRILEVSKYDKIAQFTNFTFDPCIIEIFLALSSAATLFMVSRTLRNDPNRSLKEMHSNRVSILQTTPSVFLYSWPAERLRSTILTKNSCLRALILGGEPCPKSEFLLEAKDPRNATKIYNIYGITEVSCWASINEITKKDIRSELHYLGTVLSETAMQVRNEEGRIMRKGRGFLYIGSDTRICLVDDEIMENLTRPVFRNSGDIVDIDENGELVYRGRTNSIVKKFGNKIDLTKIEGAVLELNFVKNCYALWDEEYHRLHLCLVPVKGRTEYANMKINVTKHLGELQCLYKPDKIHFLDHFEFTSSGKISLEFLRKRYLRDKSVSKDRHLKINEILKGIWKSYLNCEDGEFIKLGGTSVTALQISSAASESLNMEFPELIGMLLRDFTFDACLAYVKDAVMNNRENEFNEICNRRVIGEQTVSAINIVTEQKTTGHCRTMTNRESVCQWHKCRGRRYGDILITDQNFRFDATATVNIRVSSTFNLERCVDASPTMFQCSDGKFYVTVGSHSGFICTVELDENNSVVASYRIELPDRIEASVLPVDGLRGIVGCYDGHVYCLDLKTGQILWKHLTADVVKCTAVFCEERNKIFLGSYDTYVYCLSVKDGSVIWRSKASRGSISASGCLHSRSNTVLFGTLDGSCLALQQLSGKIVWKEKLGDPIFVAPVTLASGLVLFCTVAGRVSCFDIEVNVEMWNYTINGNVFSYVVIRSDPITSRESLILCSQNKNVYRLESKDTNFRIEPSLRCALNLHSPIFATPWCEGNLLFVACTDGVLNIYDFSEMKLLRSTKLPGKIFSSPVVNDNLITVGCRDNNVYIMKLV